MLFSGQAVDEHASAPSLGAVNYQACALIRSLEVISEQEYPPAALYIREVLLAIAKHVAGELWGMYNPQRPFHLSPADIERVRAIALVLHDLNAYQRYLLASSPSAAPPGIQFALSHLTGRYFPKGNGEPVCLVRPQWSYNCAYVPLTWLLRKTVRPAALDPKGLLGAKDPQDFLDKLVARKPGVPAALCQLAVLSFARLDTHDTLLYPVLAHELGHFIDFSFSPQPRHAQDPLRLAIRSRDVERALSSAGMPVPGPAHLADEAKRASRLATVCIRELMADLLATRMLGFGFFVAQAEFLKTVSPWDQRVIQRNGYPTINFRLRTVLDHLRSQPSPEDVDTFLKDNAESPVAESLLKYLDAWTATLTPPATKSPKTIIESLAEEAVLSALGGLSVVAAQLIPDETCAVLTPHFFERVQMLRSELPPICASETPNSFSEILSAAWAYQLTSGEEREVSVPAIEGQFAEYEKTCRLILKAIELLPIALSRKP